MNQDYYPIYVDTFAGEISSGICYASFDISKRLLELQGFEIGSLRQNAEIRINNGKESDVFSRGNITNECFVYVPDNNRFSRSGKFFSRVSLFLDVAEQVKKAHLNLEDFYLSDEQVERVLEDAVPVKDMRFNVKKLNSYAVTAGMFRGLCRDYGDFLIDCNITHIPMFTANVTDKAYARPCFFGAISNKDFPSQINGCLKTLDMSPGIRGFKKWFKFED